MADEDDQHLPAAAMALNNAQAVPRAGPVKLAQFWQEEPALWVT